jgi:hypothetical protein
MNCNYSCCGCRIARARTQPFSNASQPAVRVEAHERKRLEQLCRYITRPALSDEQVQQNAAGQVELKLKTPWRDGTTHLMMSPLEFMRRLAALVPPPRTHRHLSQGRGLEYGIFLRQCSEKLGCRSLRSQFNAPSSPRLKPSRLWSMPTENSFAEWRPRSRP